MSAIIFANHVFSADKLIMKIGFHEDNETTSIWDINEKDPEWYTRNDKINFEIDLSEAYKKIQQKDGKQQGKSEDAAEEEEEENITSEVIEEILHITTFYNKEEVNHSIKLLKNDKNEFEGKVIVEVQQIETSQNDANFAVEIEIPTENPWNLPPREKEKAIKFMVERDTTDPTITFTGVQDGEVFEPRKPFGKHVKADIGIEVIDKNFDEEKLTIQVTKNEEVQNYKFTKKDGKYLYTFQDDGKYVIKVQATDRAGNISEEDITFYIHNEGPQMSVQVGQNVIRDGEFINQNEMEVSLESLLKMKQGTFSLALDDEQHETNPIMINDSNFKWKPQLKGDGHYKLDVMVQEEREKDHREYTLDSFNFTLDTTAPEITIVQDYEQAIKNDVSKQKEVTVKVVEENFVSDVAVIELLQEADDGTWAQAENITFPKFRNTENHTYLSTLNIDKDGKYKINVTITDAANNTATASTVPFTIDQTKPEITISQEDGRDVQRDYSKYKEVNVQVKDDNFDFNKSTITVYQATEDGAFIEVEGIAFPTWETGKNDIYYSTKAFSTDGVYKIVVEAEDEAGNKSVKESEVFTIDTIEPIVNVIDENGTSLLEKDKEFISKSRNVILQVEETNFSSELTTVKVWKENSKGEFKEIQQRFSKWKQDGKQYVSSNSFTKDGTYKVEVEVIDKAGNRKKAMTEPFVVIRKLIDPYSIEGVVDKEHYKEDRDVEITIEAHYIDKAKTSVTGEVFNQQTGKYEPYDIGELEYKKKDIAKIAHTFSEEGKYRLTLTAADRAGNVAPNEVITFVIDKTAPALSISNVETYTHANQEVIVKVEERYFETNNVMFHVKKNGREITDEVEKSHELGSKWSTEAEISKLAYTFTEDGFYEIEIASQDKAGNVAKKQYLSFTLDKTKPTIEISNVKDNKHYPETKIVDFIITDVNLDHNQVEVTRNGKKYNIDEEFVIETNQYENSIAKLTHEFNKECEKNCDDKEQEGNYEVTVLAKDKAGNKTEKTIQFTIDKKDPVITIDHHIRSHINSEKLNKQGINQAIPILLTEVNVKQKNVTVEHVRLNGKKDVYKDEEIGQWVQDDKREDRYQFLIHDRFFDRDGVYTITVEAEDLSGRKDKKSMSFTVDNIAPEISISSISRYNNEAKTVKVTVNEHNYAKNKVDIQIKRENPDGTIQNYSPSWKNEGTTTTLDIPFTDDALYHIVVNATDDAGNKAKEKSATFTIDTIKPKLSIQGVENTNEVKHYNESKDVTFKVTDTNIDKEKTVLIVKRLNRGTGKMENVNVGKLAFTKTKAELKYRFSQEGLYTVELHATDKARNQAEPVKITFVIDKTAPVLSIDNVTDHAYYPANRIVAVNVQETNFKSNDVTFTVTKDGVDITNEVEGSARNASWANEKSNAKLTYNFKEDGTYTISIQAQDLAGNKAKSQQKSFTIDKTNPVIDISGVTEGEHYNTDKPVHVTIKDVNFEKNTIRVLKDGKSYSVGGFSITNHKYKDSLASLKHTFSQEGDYEILVESRDRAGNSANEKVTFTIDKTPPVITPKMKGENRELKNGEFINKVFTPEFVLDEKEDKITSVTLNGGKNIAGNIPLASKEMEYQYKVVAQDKAGNKTNLDLSFTVDTTKPKLVIANVLGKFFNKNITPTVTYSDKYLDTKKTSILLNKRLFGNELQKTKLGDYVLSESITNEGHYALKAKVTDLAKNVSEQSIYFTLDKAKPKIIFNNVLNAAYFNEVLIPELSIINELSDYEIIVLTLNGEPYEIGDPIEKDGKYVLYIEVKDQAGNIARQSIEFIVDMTPPNVKFTGVNNEDVYYDPVKMEISLDNQEDWIKSVHINDEVFEGETIEKTPDGKVSKIKLSFNDIDKYQVVVEAEDKAGNVVEEQFYFEIADKNFVLKWYENKPLFYGSLIGFIGFMAAGGAVVLQRRNRKPDETTVDKEGS